MDYEKVFLALLPLPLDSGFPNYHDFILIKEAGKICTVSFTTFGIWERGWKMIRYQNMLPLAYIVFTGTVFTLNILNKINIGFYGGLFTFFKGVSFWLHSFYGEWEGWKFVNRFNHTDWVDVVTPTERPKSVRNRCVIYVLVAFLCRHFLFLEFSVGIRSSVIGLSQISFFFSYAKY